jgi:hypothetical protein
MSVKYTVLPEGLSKLTNLKFFNFSISECPSSKEESSNWLVNLEKKSSCPGTVP